MTPSAGTLMGLGIPPRRIRICRWCPAAFAVPQQRVAALEHQRVRHGYVGPEKPKFRRGGLLAA